MKEANFNSKHGFKPLKMVYKSNKGGCAWTTTCFLKEVVKSENRKNLYIHAYTSSYWEGTIVGGPKKIGKIKLRCASKGGKGTYCYGDSFYIDGKKVAKVT